jgi:predicted MFS family arabinose efflux permease
VAAWLIALYDWRLIFVLIGIVGLVLLVPWLWLVKDDDRQLQRDSAESPAAKAVPFSRIMASPVTWGTMAAAFCYMYFVFFSLTWMPAYFIERRHLSLGRMGLYTFLSFGGMTVVAMLGGWAADLLIGRGRNPVTVRKWFTIAAFALGCTELLGARATSLNIALVFAVLSLSGLGLATANYWAITQTLIPGAAIGRITAVQNSACSLAGIVAPILTGWLLQKTGSYDAPMLTVLVVLVVGVLSYLLLIQEKYAPQSGGCTGQNFEPRRLP